MFEWLVGTFFFISTILVEMVGNFLVEMVGNFFYKNKQMKRKPIFTKSPSARLIILL